MPPETNPTKPAYAWHEWLRIDHEGEPLADAIYNSYKSFTAIELVLENVALGLRNRARAERSAARKEIVRRHKASNGAHSTVKTSRRILYVRGRLEGLELTWKEVVRPKVMSRGAEKKHWLKDVGAMRKSGVDLRHVVRGAHPDEVDLLERHEMEAREIRHLWKQAKKAKMQLAAVGRRILKHLDKADQDDA